MALKKPVLMGNGLTLGYHRIAMVKIDTNQQVSVLRYSYVNEDARRLEGTLDENGETYNPYIDYEYLSLPYSDDMNVTNAYAYLKTLPMFEGAEDV